LKPEEHIVLDARVRINPEATFVEEFSTRRDFST
jgi:hypothetical protein